MFLSLLMFNLSVCVSVHLASDPPLQAVEFLQQTYTDEASKKLTIASLVDIFFVPLGVAPRCLIFPVSMLCLFSFALLFHFLCSYGVALLSSCFSLMSAYRYRTPVL